MKKWLITLVGLSVALAAITSGGFTLASNQNDDAPTEMADEWDLVEVSGWPSGFSVRLPQGWQMNELQGVDSYVGEIVWDGGRLNFDFGWYSSSLVDDEDPQYIVTYEEIGGRQAKLVRPRVEGDGLITGVYFENIDGSNPDIPSQNRLQISGVGLSPDQQETALAVFRTIRPLDSEPQPFDDPVVTSVDEDIDPNECNWVHNIDACEGEPDPNQHNGPVNDPAVAIEPGPDIAVGEPYPLPVDKTCGPGATIAMTSDGQFSCLDLDDASQTGDGQDMVSPEAPPVVKPAR